jgi:hypothetical protein
MLRAVAAGVGVLGGVYGLAWVSETAWSWGSWIGLVFAGFISSWLAPRRRVLVGTSMAVPPTVVFGVTQTICELTGSAPTIGAAGATFLAALMLAWNFVMCGGGAVAAAVARSRRPVPVRRTIAFQRDAGPPA